MLSEQSLEGRSNLVKETVLGFNQLHLEHENTIDRSHPESRKRIETIMQLLKEHLDSELYEAQQEFPQVDQEDLLQSHSLEYLKVLKEAKDNKQEELNEFVKRFDSVFMSPGSYAAALEAVSCCRTLAEEIMTGKFRNGFALVRPPGHHADSEEACGFCLFNNAAQAAEAAFNFGADRILILDLDIHHGQGTQRIFYEDNRVLYVSIHRYQHGSFWPHLLESNYDHIGEGRGRGYNVNIPLNETGCTDSDYMAIFWNVLWPLATEFNPQFVIVSAGFDSCWGDPLGKTELSPDCYSHLIYHLKALAGGKLLMILEGGYHHQVAAEAVVRCTQVLTGAAPVPIDLKVAHKTSTATSCLNVIFQLKTLWRCFAIYRNPAGGGSFALPLNKDKYNVGDESARSNTTNIDQTTLPEYKNDIFPSYSRDSNYLLYLDNESLHNLEASQGQVEHHQRVHSIKRKMTESKLEQKCKIIEPAGENEYLTDEILEETHERPHLAWLNRIAKMSDEERKRAEEDGSSIYMTPTTREACVAAASSTVKCLDELFSEENSGRPAKCFAAVRPPGHHAGLSNASGFCFLNNVAIAANRARTKWGLKRILILDWDVHHGDGTQEIFEESEEVLYISLHRDDGGHFFPLGVPKEHFHVGKERGKGFTVNIPWSYDVMGDSEYLTAFYKVVMPIAYEFNPELVIISSGFDAAAMDPLGGFLLTPAGYSLMTYQLGALAHGRILAVLEGGYNAAGVAESAAAVVETWLTNRPSEKLDFAKLKPVSPMALVALKQVLTIQAQHWNIIKDFQLVGEIAGYPHEVTSKFEAICGSDSDNE